MITPKSSQGLRAILVVLVVFALTTDRRVIQDSRSANMLSIQGTPAFSNNSHCFPRGDKGPVPVILMSRGRSGSSSTWQILQTLTNSTDTWAEEYPGRKTPTIQAVLDQAKNTHGEWVLQKLCEKQKDYPHDSIAGFKWKPALSSHPAFVEGLDRLVEHKVKVIRSRRNALDKALSTLKHASGPTKLGSPGAEGQIVWGHCTGHGHRLRKCLEAHKLAGTGMTVNPGALLEEMKLTTEEEDRVDQLLVDKGIEHVSVTYESLYHKQDASEWQKVLSFLGMQTRERLTWEDITGAMEHVSTSNTLHNVSIANFHEVKEALEGTPFQNLLRGT